MLLTTCEEQHLLGSGALAPDALPAGAPCYVLDADGAPGTVITGAPCHWTLEAAFAGRASHAGVVPERASRPSRWPPRPSRPCRSAADEGALTANIGVIAGRRRDENVVPEACTLRGDAAHLLTVPKRKKAAMTAALEQAAARFGGSVDIDWTFSYGAVLYDEDDAARADSRRAARAAGLGLASATTAAAPTRTSGGRSVRAVTLGVGMAAFRSPEGISPVVTSGAPPPRGSAGEESAE